MVLPGIQALFGFQLIAVFNQGFGEKLSHGAQLVHLLALVLAALAMALVMTPAALHRLSEPRSVGAGSLIGAALLAVFAWLWFLLPRREHRRQGQARVP